MIEVEKKFHTSKKIYDFLYHECEFISEKIIADEYFDTKNFDLILSNRWLRNRNGRWEMKVATKDYDMMLPTYFEYETDKEIINEIGIDVGELTVQVLKDNGYEVFASFESIRKKFKKGDFLMDLDVTNFGVELIEIERMVSSEKEIDNAKEEIIEFATSIDKNIKESVIGKLRYFTINNYPNIDEKLVKNGIVPKIEL